MNKPDVEASTRFSKTKSKGTLVKRAVTSRLIKRPLTGPILLNLSIKSMECNRWESDILPNSGLR